jgi:prolyl-tRNA synthetase
LRLLRGDHQLNTIKAEKIEEANVPIYLASDEELKAAGLQQRLYHDDLDMPIFVDRSAATLSDFVTGANEINKHTIGGELGTMQVLPVYC